jgi:hypothetical protein
MPESRISESQIMRLPTREASQYVQRAYEENKAFARLHDYFKERRLQFHFKRAKVYFFLSRPAGSQRPATIAIVPSFVRVKPTDPNHEAVGIAVLSDGTSIATKVKVEHNPFRVTEFSLYRLEGNKVVAENSMPISKIRSLTPPRLSTLGATARGSSEIFMSRSVFKPIIDETFREILSDDFARPLYPDEGFKALIGQAPIVAKWAILNNSRIGATMGLKTCGCSCTCCNGCTTTSCEIEW